MEITVRDAVTAIHGMGFGALLLLCFSGAAIILYSTAIADTPWILTESDTRRLRLYFWFMALVAWLAVVVGSYVIYPWYRARPPAGTANLEGYPQRLLMSSPSTTGWHDLGMEWKEHVAWFAPICLTTVAYIFMRLGGRLRGDRHLRKATFGLLLFAFFATCVAGFFGAMLNKFAPVRGGAEITLMRAGGHG